MDHAAARATVLGALVAAHHAALTAFVRRRVGCPAIAGDIVQEAYARLAGRAAPMPPANPRAFLYRVAGNLALDHLRRERARARVLMGGPPPEQVPDPRPSAVAALEARQRLAILVRAVDELPPRCRRVFVMRRFEDRDQDEIAAALGISRNMVEKHLRRALAHCAMRLDEAGG